MKRIAPPLLAALLATACAVDHSHRLTEQEFAPVRNADEVRLFVGEVERPHVEIALVNSVATSERSDDARREQLRSLQARAAELGANAVMEVRTMREQHKGMVADPAVPFPAWKQGDTTMYFLRGTAIRWAEPDAQTPLEWEEQRAGLTVDQVAPADAATEETAPPPNIPEQQTGDSEAPKTSVRTGY